MKIAIVTEYYPDTGDPASGVYVHARAIQYRRRGHDVRVFRVRSGAPATEDFEGVEVRSADIEASTDAVRRYGPAVVAVHTPYPGTPHVTVAERVAVPRVAWIHGYEGLVTAFHGYHRGPNRALSLLEDARKLWRLRGLLARAAGVVYVSEWLRGRVERNTRFRHPVTRVIPNPVDTERFRPAAAPAPTDGALRGLAFRPLRRVQGLDIAVAAYAGLDGTDLTIVGSGPDADALREAIRRAGASSVRLEVRSIPHREVPALMSGYDYFVFPARNATQGVAMCEAMACGLPVVANRVGGVPEFVRDGTDGLLVPPGRPDALRRAVGALVADPGRLATMGRNAREYAVERCSAATVTAAELELLAQVAA